VAVLRYPVGAGDILGAITDDLFPIYVLAAGRGTGQSIKGGTGPGQNLILYGTSHATAGSIVMTDPVLFSPNAASVTGSGAVWRNTANLLKFYSGAEYTILAALTAGLAQGDIFYWDGSHVVRLAAGTSGLPLKTLGAGANPAWGTIDHNTALTNAASGDVHTQYALLAGRASDQILYGSTTAAGTLTLVANSTATPGAINLSSELSLANLGGPSVNTGRFARNGNFLEYRASSGTQRLIAVPGTAAQGDVAYFDGTAWARLAAGTLGQGLKTGGSGANPSWGITPSVQKVTANGSGTYTTPSGVLAIMPMLIGAGGGGGGAAQTTSNAAAGGGGGSGGWAMSLITSPSATYAYTIGTGGPGGTAGNNNGTAGTASTFGSITANGGLGGSGSPAGTAASFIAGGTGATVSTGSDITGSGMPGEDGTILSGTVAKSGFGGSSLWGGGGEARRTEAAGLAGKGHGSGGGGALCLGTTARAGGAGKDGALFVLELRG